MLEKGSGSDEHFKIVEFLTQVVDENKTELSSYDKNIFFTNFKEIAVFTSDFLNQNILIYISEIPVCDKDDEF